MSTAHLFIGQKMPRKNLHPSNIYPGENPRIFTMHVQTPRNQNWVGLPSKTKAL